METNEKLNTNNEFKNRCYGLVIIKSENSKFNADFTGNPRRLPDDKGTIYATDKALKYAIRQYLQDCKGKRVFVWKTYKKDTAGNYIPKTLEERFQDFNVKTPEEAFKECIDVKLFGITFAMKGKQKGESKNFSLTGPLQFSYGINRYDKGNIIYTNEILSPYRSDKKEEEAKSSTLGSESKSLSVYYVYDFTLNPKNIITHYEDNEELKGNFILNKDDISLLKDALKYGVTGLDTASKIGSENALLLFITLNENSKICLPAMKNFVEIRDDTSDPSKKIFDLEKVMNELHSKINDIEQIELYYNENIYSVSLGNFDFNEKINIDNNL